jgi:hypothetical protein
VGSSNELGNWNLSQALKMNPKSDGVWATELEVEAPGEKVLYKYVVLTEPELEAHVKSNRALDILFEAPANFTVVENLGDGVRSLAGGASVSQDSPSSGHSKCKFELVIDHGDDVLQVHVVGAHRVLGNWHEEDGMPLEKAADSNLWVGTAELPVGEDFEYKYVVWRKAKQSSEQVYDLSVPVDGSKLHITDTLDSNHAMRSTPIVTSSNHKPHSCLCKFDLRADGMPEGTSVALLGSHEFLGAWELDRALPMIRTGNSFSASMHLPVDTEFTYKYVLKAKPLWDESVRRIHPAGDSTVTRDLLQHGSAPAGDLLTSLLTVPAVVNQSRHSTEGEGDEAVCTLRLEDAEKHVVDMRHGGLGYTLGVVGNISALGNWDLKKCVPMDVGKEDGRMVFTASFKVAKGSQVEYKYVMLRTPRWEDRADNRAFSGPPADQDWKVSVLFFLPALLARASDIKV